MRKYVITISSDDFFDKVFESCSRNAKQHLIEIGGKICTVTTKGGKILSECRYSNEYGYHYCLV